MNDFFLEIYKIGSTLLQRDKGINLQGALEDPHKITPHILADHCRLKRIMANRFNLFLLLLALPAVMLLATNPTPLSRSPFFLVKQLKWQVCFP